MRYVSLILDPPSTGSSEIYSGEEPNVVRDRIYQYTMVDGDTVVMLSRFRGNLNHARVVLETSPKILTYDLVKTGCEEGLAYVHCKATDPIKSLIESLESHELILDLPIKFRSNGRIQVTLIATGETLQKIVADIPDSIRVTLNETGEFPSSSQSIDNSLTDRQTEVLRIAVENGYYKVPRQTTINDLATELDISSATLGEHLQKIEARIITKAVK